MPLKDRVRKAVIGLMPCIHGARIEESAEESGKSPRELLDFSVNLNPLGQPRMGKILAGAYQTIGNYPDNRYMDFRQAAAESLGIRPENIIPGNGSSELIRLFAETVIESGDEVIIPAPTFGEYEFQSRLFGASVKYVDYNEIARVSPDDCKAVFLCNPNNPTGNLIKREDILNIARKCSDSSTFLFVDEAFIELSDPRQSVADLAATNDFVIVLRSLTKTYAIPGLRIGFAVASVDFAGLLNNIRLPWNLNSVALTAGARIIRNNKRYLDRTLSLIGKER
ncbi:MAG TPA: aminotransferase class I/II-fold pyridoxal phosphate-dependent enzyme, partial [Candidatus Methanoperedens sp.]